MKLYDSNKSPTGKAYRKVTTYRKVYGYPYIIESLRKDYGLKDDDRIRVMESHIINTLSRRGYRTPFKHIFHGTLKEFDSFYKKKSDRLYKRRSKYLKNKEKINLKKLKFEILKSCRDKIYDRKRKFTDVDEVKKSYDIWLKRLKKFMKDKDRIPKSYGELKEWWLYEEYPKRFENVKV